MKLGRMEDPSFTIRQMVVSVAWPGATTHRWKNKLQIRLRKIARYTGLDYVKSFSRSGEAVIYVNLRDDIDNDKIRPTWLEVRNMVDDIKRIYQKAFMHYIIMTDLMMYMVLYMLSQVIVILMKKCVKRQKK